MHSSFLIDYQKLLGIKTNLIKLADEIDEATDLDNRIEGLDIIFNKTVEVINNLELLTKNNNKVDNKNENLFGYFKKDNEYQKSLKYYLEIINSTFKKIEILKKTDIINGLSSYTRNSDVIRTYYLKKPDYEKLEEANNEVYKNATSLLISSIKAFAEIKTSDSQIKKELSDYLEQYKESFKILKMTTEQLQNKINLLNTGRAKYRSLELDVNIYSSFEPRLDNNFIDDIPKFEEILKIKNDLENQDIEDLKKKMGDSAELYENFNKYFKTESGSDFIKYIKSLLEDYSEYDKQEKDFDKHFGKIFQQLQIDTQDEEPCFSQNELETMFYFLDISGSIYSYTDFLESY